MFRLALIVPALGLLIALAPDARPAAPPGRPPATAVPPWDARGVGPLPWQGVACLDVNADATRIALGTIAPAGDANVLLLDGDGRLLRQGHAGQRWIQQVSLGPDDVLRALCTMPAGRAGDVPDVFRLTKDRTASEGLSWRRNDYVDNYFHYGDHSNHVTRLMARQGDETVVVNGDQVLWLSTTGAPVAATFPLGPNDIPVSLAVGDRGFAVVGTTAAPGKGAKESANLHILRRGHPRPLWSRALLRTGASPGPEKGLYGTPTLPDGRREELPQRDEKLWAPLAVAIHVRETAAGPRWQVAAADGPAWRRWIRSSATGREENYGVRFMPSAPTVSVYDQDGAVVRRFEPSKFLRPFWCSLQFFPDGRRLLAAPRSWACRGLAGQPLLPTDEGANTLYVLDTRTGARRGVRLPDAISDVAVTAWGAAVGCWDGNVHLLPERALGEGVREGPVPVAEVRVGGPSLVRTSRDGRRIVVAATNGVVRLLDAKGKELWKTDLNRSVKRAIKPWVANARAMPVGKGVWNLPGGRVESDLGGQWLIEAPDGLVLIEGHSGLSFEREWAAIESVGLDPKKVRYILGTHEHGDHSPGSYLWRVVTGAKFVCSREMAYTLQHHIPIGTGYGFNPPVPTDIAVTKDTTLDLAGLKMHAVRIPGHTFGSMAWHFEKGGKSYVSFGDLIMPKGVLGYSGSINFSARDALASLRKLQALRPDVVLPGHGSPGGPGNYLKAGIEVAVAGGWGLVRPEKPDPYFRITQKNVLPVAWNVGATSAAFGDVDGDGRPDVVAVVPKGEGSVVQIYLNRGGKFAAAPDHEVRIPGLARPNKVRVLEGGKGARATLFVGGQSAALLLAEGKLPQFKVLPFDIGDAHQARFIEHGGKKQVVVATRFGGLWLVEETKRGPRLVPFLPGVRGAYLDVREADVTGDGRKALITSYGQVFLRGPDGKLPERPTLTLETEKGDWSFLAVGDFNGDGRPDAALLSYGMAGRTVARVFYNTGKIARPFNERPDAIIPLGLSKDGKSAHTLLRDAPVVCDWDCDGVADLVVGKGQSDEVLVLLGGRGGLDAKRSRTITLDYRVHYETGLYVGDFNGDGRADLACFGYTLTGVGWSGPTAAYVWLKPAREKKSR
jgi:glyoxylase-like metal-dependent hydrolase (beta-lactamase superfamily II)